MDKFKELNLDELYNVNGGEYGAPSSWGDKFWYYTGKVLYYIGEGASAVKG